ncbi:MAG: ribosome assembly cofactor RimP [Ginsengibacter sp.]
MIAASPQNAIENYITALLQKDEDVFLVEIKINPGNNIKVFVDTDNGITIEKCVHINRALYKHIEENSLFENGNFSLEVSSPGIDEPLKLKRQYKKNIGRTIEILLNDESKKQGKLLSAGDDEIIIEEKEGRGKNLINKHTTILFNQIKHTKVLVTF